MSDLPKPSDSSRIPWIETGMVLAFIGALVAIAIPSAKYVTAQAKIAEAKAVMSRLVEAVHAYRAVYHRFPPVEQTTVGADFETDTSANSGLMNILNSPAAAGAPAGSPGPKQFFTPPENRNRKTTILTDGTLLDPWGHPYHVIFDANGDSKIANPFAKDAGARSILLFAVIVWSDGPDGLPHSGDEVKSWM